MKSRKQRKFYGVLLALTTALLLPGGIASSRADEGVHLTEEEAEDRARFGNRVTLDETQVYILDEDLPDYTLTFSAESTGSTLDLNGHSIGGVASEAALTIRGEGTVSSLGSYIAYPDSDITVEGGTYSFVRTRGKLTVKDGTFQDRIQISEQATLTISGGTFEGGLASSDGTVLVSGGTFSSDTPFYLSAEHLTLSGGTFELTNLSEEAEDPYLFIMYGDDVSVFRGVLADGYQFSNGTLGSATLEEKDGFLYLAARKASVIPAVSDDIIAPADGAGDPGDGSSSSQDGGSGDAGSGSQDGGSGDEGDPIPREITEEASGTMYRLYNPNSGEHFYTAEANEARNLQAVGWTYEGTAWVAPSADESGTPVYRLYNPNSGEHHYTTVSAERDYLIEIGWRDEGIGWYSDDAKTTPLYRLYNRNATGEHEAGGHHYTKEESERDYLVSLGWEYEGIGWYGK